MRWWAFCASHACNELEGDTVTWRQGNGRKLEKRRHVNTHIHALQWEVGAEAWPLRADVELAALKDAGVDCAMAFDREPRPCDERTGDR